MLRRILIYTLIFILCVAKIAPIVAQETVANLGEWKIEGLTNLKFTPAFEIKGSYNDHLYFSVKYPEGLKAIVVGLFVHAGVFVVFGNDTTNSTQIMPDQNGIYTLLMPEIGYYHLYFVSSASAVPLIGRFFKPSSEEIVIVRLFDYTPLKILIISMAGLIIGSYGVKKWLKYRKRKKAKEK